MLCGFSLIVDEKSDIWMRDSLSLSLALCDTHTNTFSLSLSLSRARSFTLPLPLSLTPPIAPAHSSIAHSELKTELEHMKAQNTELSTSLEELQKCNARLENELDIDVRKWRILAEERVSELARITKVIAREG